MDEACTEEYHLIIISSSLDFVLIGNLLIRREYNEIKIKYRL